MSSARVVRCWVKSRNEQPLSSVASSKMAPGETAGDNPRKVGDDVKSSCPYDLGHTCYNGVNKVEAKPDHKNNVSFDCGVATDYMKLESLVIADQNAAVNTFPGLVHTARHTMGVINAQSQ